METDGREQTDQGARAGTGAHRRTDGAPRLPPTSADLLRRSHPATGVIGCKCHGSGSGMDRVIEIGHAMDMDNCCISLDYVALAWPRDISSLCSIDAADNSKLNGI